MGGMRIWTYPNYEQVWIEVSNTPEQILVELEPDEAAILRDFLNKHVPEGERRVAASDYGWVACT